MIHLFKKTAARSDFSVVFIGFLLNRINTMRIDYASAGCASVNAFIEVMMPADDFRTVFQIGSAVAFRSFFSGQPVCHSFLAQSGNDPRT
jgi:hypothetical protein